jgi:antitoxin (DNA-binding transcriptional repressor) of toxin-antitoxin stability system
MDTERDGVRVGEEVFVFLEALDLQQATGRLRDYVSGLDGEPLVITEREMPIAVLVPVQGMDLEDLSLGTDPNFHDLIERSRREMREKGGISLEEMRRRLRLDD